MSQLPVIAITMGDPCGIGPEVVAKALALKEVRDLCLPLVIGSAQAMQHGVAISRARLSVREAQHPGDVDPAHGVVSVLDPHNLNYEDVALGQVSPVAGKACMQWVELAGRLCLGGGVSAMATAPVNKEAASLAGYKEIGHMELLQAMTRASNVATMLISGALRVVHLTTHRSLRRACDAVTRDNILGKLKLTDDYFKQWGFPQPRIGVAALNPHGSDGGLLGDEEATQIEPAVNDARALGILATGPVPADIIFNQAIDGKYDAVLCMYHDQGHIPVKVHGFEESVSVNLGLPLVRTSVDHGTAFDIAGKGVAQAVSMVEAIKLAAMLAGGKGLPR
ncbi:MAG: 4-hydroxythreonine-4-phosphate dehydrogenase PdxA [Chloroflexi bacterium]|nr:4-hydroxythreonine-4-phosphate dehydrogenase PdxA [Chloroflexota bacterium]